MNQSQQVRCCNETQQVTTSLVSTWNFWIVFAINFFIKDCNMLFKGQRSIEQNCWINLLKSLTDECSEKRKSSLLKGHDFLSDLIHLFVLCFAIWILSWLIFAISFLFSKFESFLGLFLTLSSRALPRFKISFFSLMFSRSVSANWWLISLSWFCIWLNSANFAVNNVSVRLYSNSDCNCLFSIVFL